MMNLEEQLQVLIDEAPQHGVSVAVMEKAVVPVLKLLANQLQYSQYYVLHRHGIAKGELVWHNDWLIAKLQRRDNPQQQKRVIYAFATRKDATSFQGVANPQIRIVSLPITHLLFELFAIESVDSIIFMETPGDVEKGKEIQRANLQHLIQQQLRRLKLSPTTKPKNIPPNFA